MLDACHHFGKLIGIKVLYVEFVNGNKGYGTQVELLKNFQLYCLQIFHVLAYHVFGKLYHNRLYLGIVGIGYRSAYEPLEFIPAAASCNKLYRLGCQGACEVIQVQFAYMSDIRTTCLE